MNMDIQIFADNIDCRAQIDTIANSLAYSEEKIRIMPDCHAGVGGVVGFTATYTDAIDPQTVGNDICCGMEVVKLGQVEIDFPKLDKIVQLKIPSGLKIRDEKIADFNLKKLKCISAIDNSKYILRSIGTLGGGNHFIEIDQDDEQNCYLVIHTGSRNLGKQVCAFYASLTDEGYIEGRDMLNYIHDVKICGEFARLNRETIAEIIISKYWKGKHLKDFEHFETLHNYIDTRRRIVRKGAISAQIGEQLIIPMNMRDGSLLCVGKGNEDWNCSAPHGAGRLLSRGEARKIVTVEEYEQAMQGIYSTTVNERTLDESPFAYKPMDAIIERIQETVEVAKIIRPVYNFKAAEDVRFWRK